MEDAAASVLEQAVRAAGDRIRAALAARFRDLDLAEEAFAFACAAAAEAWRRDGPPQDPAAWLYAAGRRRGVDLTRRAKVRGAYRPDEPEPVPTPEEAAMARLEPIPDERLRLIFACCHPALAAEARIALTLRVICGMSVERLAQAFLVGETAMVQRLTRAKQKIRAAKIPFEVPGREAWGERLEAVLAALEIAYAQAYEDAAGAGEGAGFAAETLRLSGVLVELLPAEPEVLGLAALIRLAESRRRARQGADGGMIPLSEQDPALWDAGLMREAATLLGSAAALRRTGPYQILAAIHAAHASRRETGVTPWADIAALYDALVLVRPSAVVEVNRAVALEHVAGPAAALAALIGANAEGRLDGYAPYHAAMGRLCAVAGRRDEARAALRRALELVRTPAERLFLGRRLADLA
jgi:RNA polymerase sigma-70 factor (ECF subfamily)